MGRRKNGVPPPVILLISPTQFATKFMTQEHVPQIAARLKVRKVGEHGGFEVPVTIQNPEYKPEKAAMEGDGKKRHHLFGKKARKIIRGATKAAEIGAAVTAAVPGLEEFSPGLAAASAAGEVAGRGFTHRTPADTEMRRCIDDCRETRNAKVRASKIAGRGPEQPPKKSKKKPRYTLM